MFKDIYLHNQEQIARQQKTIDSLENLASHYQQYDSVGVEVAPEIKVLFPNVTDIAISKTISAVSIRRRETRQLLLWCVIPKSFLCRSKKDSRSGYRLV